MEENNKCEYNYIIWTKSGKRDGSYLRKAEHKTNTDLLSFSLVSSLILVINAAKIGHDDGNWKGDDQDTAKRTNTAHYLAYHSGWHHVTVPVSWWFIYFRFRFHFHLVGIVSFASSHLNFIVCLRKV